MISKPGPHYDDFMCQSDYELLDRIISYLYFYLCGGRKSGEHYYSDIGNANELCIQNLFQR